MKKIILLLVATLLFGSCNDQLREDEKQMAEDVSQKTLPHYLFSNAIAKVVTYYQDEGFKGDESCAVMQYYQQLFSQGSQHFTEFTGNPDDWNTEYGILRHIRSASAVAAENERPAYIAALDILEVFMFAYMTDRFGDIPYSEALRGREGLDYVFPKYDDQKSIYDDMLARLDAAASTLGSTSDIFDQRSYDLMYNGEKSQWVKFANSLKLRLLVRSYDAYSKAGVDKGSEILALANSVFSANSDNAAVPYTGANDLTSWPLGVTDDVEGDDLTRRKPSVTFVNTLKNLQDPRLYSWIAPALYPWASAATDTVISDIHGNDYTVRQLDVADARPELVTDFPLDEIYIGAPIAVTLRDMWDDSAESGDYDNFKMSNFTTLYRNDEHGLLNATLMNADEAQFCLAEAAARGWISGDASSYYKAGIRLSCERWNIAEADIVTYLASPAIQLDGTNDLDRIANQKWLALFTVAAEAYVDFRRTFLPQTVADGMIRQTSESFPFRYRYTADEKANNKENVDAAIASQGADDQYTKMWLLK